ncbi:MAG: AEC family transporter [Oscillospiraceae bacterium]|nr:AEC family transporter [Oscillospiraceae bacterium]
MLDSLLSVIEQVFTIFLLIGVGFVITKTGLLNDGGSKQLSNLILMIIVPAVIINAFEAPYDSSKLAGLCAAAVIATAAHLLGIAAGKIFFRKTEESKRVVYRFSIVYSNCGFFALPLISAIVGREGLFYGVVFIVIFNIFSWTHGVALMTGSKKNISLKKIFLSPGIVGIFIALILFFFPINLPAPVSGAISMLASANTPLAMIVVGSFMANVDFKSMMKKGSHYLAASMRLLVIPIIIIAAMRLFDMPEVILKALAISAAAPSAANVTLFAAKFNKDTSLGSEVIAFSTFFSILTLPLLLAALT